MSPLERMHAALKVVHGVELDAWAAAVARYRLLALGLVVLRGEGCAPAPAEIAALPLQVACTDALLDTTEPLLERGRYDVVVANPPYITVKNQALNRAIRERYPLVCAGRYSMALPFHALMTELLRPGGWCAQLTSNAFMKREFGRRYVETFLAGLDLTWVIDTSGAYIPGHGTPTLILANRNQPPASDTVATVRGIRGEPSTPADPSRGRVWSAIRDAVRERESLRRLADAISVTAARADVSQAANASGTTGTTYRQPTLDEFWTEQVAAGR
jgi:hypothetical protein